MCVEAGFCQIQSHLVLPKLSEQQRKNDVIVVDADSNVQATVEVCFYIYIIFNFHISLIMLDQFIEQPDVSFDGLAMEQFMTEESSLN